MNQSEYLANTDFNVTIKMNKSFSGDTYTDLWYGVNQTPDADCKIDHTTGTNKDFSFTLTQGALPAKCSIADGAVISVLIRDSTGGGISYLTNYSLEVDQGDLGPGTGQWSWNFTVDGASPTSANIGLNATGQTGGITTDSWQTSMLMRFNGTDSTASTLNYVFYVNDVANTTGSNLSSSAIVNISTLTGLQEGGYYNVTLEIKDNVSNGLNSSAIKFFYDATNPTAARLILANESWVNSLTFNINATDGSGENLNYTVYVNATANVTGSDGNGATAVALTGLLDGKSYNVFVAAMDNASNTLNNSDNNISFYYDGTAPSVSVIQTPSANNTWVTTMFLAFNGSDAVVGTLNYTIYVNGTSNVTGTNLTTIGNNASLTGLQDGKSYEVILEVEDNATNKLNSSPLILNYDGVGPTISVSNNNTVLSTRTVSFNVTDSGRGLVNLSSIAVTNLGGSSVFNASMCSAITNGYTCSYIENGLEVNQTNFIQVDAKDNASNAATQAQYAVNLSATYKYNKTLAEGWNLVSTPFILENNTVNNILANNTNITAIYAFDGSSFTSWTSASPCDSGASCLTTISPLEGYWVETSKPTKIHFFGNLTTGTPARGYGWSNPKTLSASTWYLIGHYATGSPYGDDGSTDDALTSLCATGGLCSAGYANFDSLSWYDTTNSRLNSTVQSTWSGDAIWDRGAGFWIYMNAADTLRGTP